MADWSAPVITTAYATMVTNFKDRDVESATMFSVSTPTNTPTGAIKFDTGSTTSTLQKWNGTAWADAITTWFTPALSVTGTSSFGGLMQSGTGVSTGSCAFEVGGLRSGAGDAYFDLHAVASTDYEVRIARLGGANGAFTITNTGTGGFGLVQAGAAPITFSTTNTERARIDQDGNLIIGATTAARGGTGRALIEMSGSTTAMVALRAGGVEQGYVYATSSGLQILSTAYMRYIGTTGHLWTTNGVESARITTAGDMGIGTNAPGGRLEVRGGAALINAWGGTTASPTEAVSSTTPSLAVEVYGTGTTRIAQSWSLPGDPLSFSDNSQWNLRLSQTANSTTSAGVSGATLAGPGFLALGSGGAERLRIMSTGLIGIGNTAPTVALDVTGAIRASGDITAFSDVRLKENLVLIPSALEKVKALAGVTYDRVDTGDRSVGLVAQDVREVLPEAVREGADGYLSVNYNGLVGLLVEAIKELAA